MFFRRPLTIQSQVPVISFTFDDFPRSALLTGGTILRRFGLTATYYASLGLMGTQAPTGPIFVLEDLKLLLEQGHELGSHTFDHCNAWETKPCEFEKSVSQNEVALRELCPEASFRTLSYPIDPPRPLTKQRVARHFVCCRGGGQTFNVGRTDLNFLRAYFLDRDRSNPQAVRDVVDENRRAQGWLIFATHDICDAPTRFGCTPRFFEDVVRYAVNSDARILPVLQAYESLRAPGH